MRRTKTTEPETHVVFSRLTFSDAGSTPAASNSIVIIYFNGVMQSIR